MEKIKIENETKQKGKTIPPYSTPTQFNGFNAALNTPINKGKNRYDKNG